MVEKKFDLNYASGGGVSSLQVKVGEAWSLLFSKGTQQGKGPVGSAGVEISLKREVERA